MSTYLGDFYLAHNFDFRKKARKWQIDFENRTGIKLINPFYDIERRDIQAIDAGKIGRYEAIDPESLVLNDLAAIQKAKYGIVALVTPAPFTCGTLMEIVYAKIMNKKVYTVVTNGHEKHPWLIFHSDRLFDNFYNLEDFLIGTYGKKTKKK